jgi:hypothetical protein
VAQICLRKKAGRSRKKEVERQMIYPRLAVARLKICRPVGELRWNGLMKRAEECCQRGLAGWSEP